MANEEKKDFNAMLHDSKDMPKFQIITDQKSIDIPYKPDISSEHEEITLPSAESYRLFP